MLRSAGPTSGEATLEDDAEENPLSGNGLPGARLYAEGEIGSERREGPSELMT